MYGFIIAVIMVYFKRTSMNDRILYHMASIDDMYHSELSEYALLPYEKFASSIICYLTIDDEM